MSNQSSAGSPMRTHSGRRGDTIGLVMVSVSPPPPHKIYEGYAAVLALPPNPTRCLARLPPHSPVRLQAAHRYPGMLPVLTGS